jgi:plasmid maintenance system antidote protein VapI
MAILVGTTLMGKVDEVPRLGHVATQFLHVNYIPLIPTGSYFVFSDAGAGFQGVKIPLSVKSIMTAWLRAALAMVFLVAVVGAIIATSEKKMPEAVGVGFAGALAIAAFCATYYVPFIARASYHRAIQLAREVGASDEFLLLLDVHYGQKSAAEADLELERIEEQRAATRMTIVE